MKKALTYLFVIGNSLLTAMVYQLFVFPNGFAPAGIGGVCTMIQYLLDINVGYLNLLINLPLAIAVYFLVSKPMALRAFVYSIFFSAFLVLFEKTGILNGFLYKTDHSAILGPLVGGIIMGYSCAVMLKIGCHQAGVYFISSLVHHYRPEFNFSWVSFSLNIVVAICSFFVYGMRLEPVLLCVLYCFTSSLVNDKVTKSSRSAVRFEIVTEDPEALSQAIIHQLHHSATLIPGKGIYQGKETSVLVCVVNKSQATALSAVIRSVPGCFAIMSQVNEVMGNFRRLDTHGNEEKHLLDAGDHIH